MRLAVPTLAKTFVPAGVRLSPLIPILRLAIPVTKTKTIRYGGRARASESPFPATERLRWEGEGHAHFYELNPKLRHAGESSLRRA